MCGAGKHLSEKQVYICFKLSAKHTLVQVLFRWLDGLFEDLGDPKGDTFSCPTVY